MDLISSAGLLLGGSFSSGVNLYMTFALLGIAQRMHWLSLPGDLQILGHPLIIALAVIIYAVEFIADKIPFVDSAWDSVHTFIRPLGGLLIGYLASSEWGPVAQGAVGLLTGGIALQSHLTKAASRAAINTSPEPFSNTAASIGEDSLVATMMFLIIKHPVIAAMLAAALIVASFFLLKLLFKFLKKVFQFFSRKKELEPAESSVPDQPPAP